MAKLHEDRRRARSFGDDAERYDRVRPGYPSALVDHLLAGPAQRVLDVGCGTGIAGALFAARGCDVLGVEPDERMAQVARRRGLIVEIGAFEDWDPGERRFGLLICGQAWHWIDPQRGAARAAACLEPGGRAAVFWNFATPAPELRAALAPAYREHAPDLERYSVLLGNADDRILVTRDALVRSGCFARSELATWGWSRRYTTVEWCEHLLSHSDHQALPASRRDVLLAAVGEALEGLGGAFTMDYQTRAVIAARTA